MINQSNKMHGDKLEDAVSSLGDPSASETQNLSGQAESEGDLGGIKSAASAVASAEWAGALGVIGVLALGTLAYYLAKRRRAVDFGVAALGGTLPPGAHALDPELRDDLQSGRIELAD